MFANEIQVSNVVDTPKDKVSLPGITSIFAERRTSDGSPSSDPGSSSSASRPGQSPPTITSHYHPSTPNAPTLVHSSSYPLPSSSDRSTTLDFDNWSMNTPRERGPPPPYSASAPPPQTPNTPGGALYTKSSPSQEYNNTLVVVPPAATPPSVSYPSLPPGPPPSELPNTTGVQPPRRRGKLPKQVTETLRTWLMAHSDHPYPTEDEKKMLCNATGLSISQVSNWMINARRRILVPANKALGPASPYNIAHRPNSASGLSLSSQHHLSSNPYPSHYPRPTYPDPSLRSTSYNGNNGSATSNSLTLYPPNQSNHLPLPHQNHLQQQHELSHHNPIRSSSSSYALGSAPNNSYNNYPLRSVPFSGAQQQQQQHHHHHPSSYNLSAGSQALGGYPGVTPTGLPLLSTPLAPTGYGSAAATGPYGGASAGTITLINPSSASSNGSSANGEVTQPSGPQGSSRFY